MLFSNPSEIVLVVIGGTLLMFLLVGAIVFFVLSYQKRYLKHKHDIKALEQAYNQELLKSELEIKEQTMNNIASEIHDHIGQLLSVIKLNLAMNPAPGLSETKELVTQVIKDVRGLAHSMHSDGISNKPIYQLIKTEAERLKKLTTSEVHFSITGSNYPLDPQTEVFLFRIFQECMNNILKHAHAKNISVELNYNISLLTIKITDDGNGFVVNEVEEGLGLRSIRYRAKLIGAQLSIESSPGSGTCTTIKVNTDNQPIHGN